MEGADQTARKPWAVHHRHLHIATMVDNGRVASRCLCCVWPFAWPGCHRTTLHGNAEGLKVSTRSRASASGSRSRTSPRKQSSSVAKPQPAPVKKAPPVYHVAAQTGSGHTVMPLLEVGRQQQRVPQHEVRKQTDTIVWEGTPLRSRSWRSSWSTRHPRLSQMQSMAGMFAQNDCSCSGGTPGSPVRKRLHSSAFTAAPAQPRGRKGERRQCARPSTMGSCTTVAATLVRPVVEALG